MFGHKTGLGLLEQVVAELAWATRLFTKTKNLAHSLEECTYFWTSYKNKALIIKALKQTTATKAFR